MAKSLKYKDINLIAAQGRRQKAAREEKAVVIRQPILILILVLLLLGLAYYYLYTDTRALEQEKTALTLYLTDPTTVAGYSESKKLQESADRMVSQKNELGQVLLNLSGYPDMQGGDFHLLYEYAGERIGVSNVSYKRETGVLSFHAVCKEVTAVPMFVAQLRMSAVFSDIRYEGYTEQVTSYTVQLEPQRAARFDEVGDPVLNAAGEQVYDLIPQTRTYNETAYLFSVTALVRAPDSQMPGAGWGRD